METERWREVRYAKVWRDEEDARGRQKESVSDAQCQFQSHGHVSVRAGAAASSIHLEGGRRDENDRQLVGCVQFNTTVNRRCDFVRAADRQGSHGRGQAIAIAMPRLASPRTAKRARSTTLGAFSTPAVSAACAGRTCNIELCLVLGSQHMLPPGLHEWILR